MRHSALDDVYCSVARSWAVVGERWTMLVLREAFLRTRRFEDFQRRLGIARNVLAERLARLVEEGVLERRLYQDRPPRHEYRLTQKGLDLYPALVALMQWGDRYACTAPPVTLVHEPCGAPADPRFVCSACGEEIDPRDMRPEVAEGAFELPAR
jgi:DNA-binding HxlR family transcriptional regulator